MRRAAVLTLTAAATALAAGGCSDPPRRTTLPTASPRTASAAPTTSSPVPAPAGDVTQYHRDGARSGDDPSAAAASGPMRVEWRLSLDGAVYAQPLLVGGTLIAATERNSLYGVRDGRVAWRTNVGRAVPLSSLPCGNIDPLGITGTPAYDAATRSVFAVAEVDDPIRHVLVALDPATGAVRWRKDVDPSGMVARAQQQRAALAVSRGRVWIAFGGLYGDCGQYRGWVVGVRTDGSDLVDYVVPTRREGGIWAPSGPAVAANGDLFVAVGNGAAGSGDAYDHTDSVLRLSGVSLAGWFAPSSWARENDADLDLGSMGPALVDGGRRLVQGGKAGDVYLLDGAHLGGFDGDLARLRGCAAYGGAAARGSLVLLPCREGVTAVAVVDGSRLERRWRASVTGSPVIGRDSVYVTDRDRGTLVRLALASGELKGSVGVGEVSRFATPVTSGNEVYVPTLTGVTAVRVAP